MAKIFDSIQIKKPRRNNFPLSHVRHASMKMGYLYPVLCQEIVPGDEFDVSMEHLARLQALEAPAFTNIDLYTHTFFVPYRLIWDDFEEFITGGNDGTSEPPFPTISKPILTEENKEFYEVGGLPDHLGFPVQNFSEGISLPRINRLPFSAYQLIYNEFFRDQNLTNEVEIRKSSGNMTSFSSTLTVLRKRAWEKDYFTSALPWAQRGADMRLPVYGIADIYQDQRVGTTPSPVPVYGHGDGTVSAGPDPASSPMFADLQDASSSTVNELRTAFSIQRWLEKNARVGSRYIEQILGHFGVRVKDYRLQRPEFIAGGKTPVVISEVLQNSATQPDSPQGTMAGHGVSAGNTNRFKKKFYEHGILMSIMSIKPRTTYQDGIPRLFGKFDKYDYLIPDFAHLGEQPVYNYEIYSEGDQTDDLNKSEFGYQPRYAEYRFINNSVHGDFRDTLSFWVQPRRFGEPVMLNQDFVECNPNTDIFAVTEMDQILVTTYNKINARRPLPLYGTPGGI